MTAFALPAYATVDEAALEAFGFAVGACVRGGDVVLLEGGMGAGKTTFTRALARGMGIERADRVCSPTYTLCMVHRGPSTLVHVDLFRLELGGAGFEALGLGHEELARDDCVLVVEWAERLAEDLPTTLRLLLAHVPDRPDHRRIGVLEAASSVLPLVADLLAKTQ